MKPSDTFLLRLIELWPLPSQRHHTGQQIGFESIQRDLGICLPLSYMEMTHSYGQGIWFETIYVLNPFMAWLNNLEPWMSVSGFAGGPSWCNSLRASQAQIGHIRSPIFPEPGGLFPWAFLQDGGVLYWLTEGPPKGGTPFTTAR